jgi:hypothetical protein
VASGALQFEHDGRQLVIGNFTAFAQVADLIVLAEIAKQVAVGKKYGA